MSCVSTKVVGHDLVAAGSNGMFKAYTDWMPFTGLDEVEIVLNFAKKSGDFSAQPAWQAARIRPDDPRTSINGIGSAVDTEGVRTRFTQTFTAADDQQNPRNLWVRFGVLYDAVNSTGAGYANIILSMTMKRCGRIAGSIVNRNFATFEDSASTPEAQYAIITPWLSSLQVSKAKAAVILTSLNSTSNLEYTIVYRTAATDPTNPNTGWTTLAAYVAPNAVDEETFINDTTPTLGSNAFVQFALGFKAGTGSPGVFTASAIVATRT